MNTPYQDKNNDLINRRFDEQNKMWCVCRGANIWRTVTAMIDECKWMQDEVCVNADCPACADYCPVANTPGVCKYEERGDSDAQKSKRQTGAK